MTGGALAFFLEAPTADRDTFDKAIQALENRYSSANRIELFKLKFQERKFNLSRETPEDYLTDLTKLANLAFPNPTGGDRSQERSRRIRDAFISGMPSQLRLKLLMEPDTKTVQELCTFVSKRLALKTILPDEEATSTAFNALSVNDSANPMTEALNSIADTNRELVKTQKELGNNMQRLSRGIIQRRPYRGFMRSRGQPKKTIIMGKTHLLAGHTETEVNGLIVGNLHNAIKLQIPTEGEEIYSVTAVDNRDIKKVTVGLKLYRNVGQTSHSTDTTHQKTESTTLSNGYCPSM